LTSAGRSAWAAAGGDEIMTTRYLLALFDSVYVLALAALAGGIVFFTFIVAPVIFRVLGAESGARFVRALFPRYYLWNAILGSIALPAFVAGPLCFPEFRGIRIGIQAAVLLGCILSMLYGGNSLVPEINRARDAGPESHDRFVRLHRRSVLLNASVMIAGIGLLVAFACRPAPRTEGIVELSPRDRIRLEEERLREKAGRAGADATPKPADVPGSPRSGEP
jgi:hypothetical protein